MEIPAKIKIPLCIEQGCVYNFHIDFSDSKKRIKESLFCCVKFVSKNRPGFNNDYSYYSDKKEI